MTNRRDHGMVGPVDHCSLDSLSLLGLPPVVLPSRQASTTLLEKQASPKPYKTPTMSKPSDDAWPVIPLLVPKDYHAHRKTSSTERCLLVHVADQGLLHVVAEETSDVLDVIDLEDMIGAKLVIEPSSSSKKDAKDSATTGADDRASNEPPSDSLQDTQGRAVLTLYSYPRQNLSQKSWLTWCGVTSQTPPPNSADYQRPTKDMAKLYGPRVAHHRSFTLSPSEDLREASALVARLQQLARPKGQEDDEEEERLQRSNPKVLVLVNPTAGPKKNGQHVAETVVLPMLQQAGRECMLLVLEHADHALELARDKVTIADPDYEDEPQHLSDYSALVLVGGDGTVHQVIQGLHDTASSRPQQVIGVVGSGTANGLCKSLLHEAGEQYGVIEAVLLICKGQVVRTDLSRYTTKNNSYMSFLTFSWAMVADIDIDSEAIHFVGEMRFDIWAALRILWLRLYRGKFSYLKPDKAAASITMPALNDPVPSDWETIEDDFVLFWASHVSHASMNNFQSPNSRMDDGVFQICIIRAGPNKFRLFQVLLGLESGAHVNVPGLEFVECVAYRLEPLSPGSHNDLDGEVIESGPIQGVVQPGALHVFGKRKQE